MAHDGNYPFGRPPNGSEAEERPDWPGKARCSNRFNRRVLRAAGIK